MARGRRKGNRARQSFSTSPRNIGSGQNSPVIPPPPLDRYDDQGSEQNVRSTDIRSPSALDSEVPLKGDPTVASQGLTNSMGYFPQNPQPGYSGDPYPYPFQPQYVHPLSSNSTAHGASMLSGNHISRPSFVTSELSGFESIPLGLNQIGRAHV